jgi:hypothetical protein
VYANRRWTAASSTSTNKRHEHFKPAHMTHTVTGVKRLELETTDGRDAALEIQDEEGKVTIMHFESERPAF